MLLHFDKASIDGEVHVAISMRRIEIGSVCALEKEDLECSLYIHVRVREPDLEERKIRYFLI